MAVSKSVTAGRGWFPSLLFIVKSCLVLTVALTAATNAAEDLCQFTKYKESKSLEASKKRLSPLVGKTFKSRDKNNYEYTVGICANVAKLFDDVKLENVAVMQQKLDEEGKLTQDFHDVGNLKDTHIMTGSDWILLEYKSEEKYQTHCNSEGKRSTIMIACDENVGDSDARMVFIEEENGKHDSCYYLFEMKHKAVCPVPSAEGLSVGSILVIIFISLTAVYLIVGFLYSRFVLGAKGMEQIPNYEFWKDFGNLQADGCDFLCRTKDRRRSGGFGGIGDDQLDQTDDIGVVHDENLLPM
ncbi:cation-dependent mannose-6-phosphate receptor-like [Plakobranchus ocellatus]|uniref:Cation-dependent mannose-6-phosphate receptor-like n=1 Tax=Plakobranchus ocellatus TaxID=259542 RepID=A0AAV4CRN0_9GAST|nr:cation-dependent mannose-6-phosphate receptor-like [Plakobranchus ocellatus]